MSSTSADAQIAIYVILFVIALALLFKVFDKFQSCQGLILCFTCFTMGAMSVKIYEYAIDHGL